MPLLSISDQQRAVELRRAVEWEAGERLRRREKLLVLVACVCWNLIGLVIMMAAMITNDTVRAEGLWALGPLVGYGGMGLTLLWYFLRLSDRGEI